MMTDSSCKRYQTQKKKKKSLRFEHGPQTAASQSVYRQWNQLSPWTILVIIFPISRCRLRGNYCCQNISHVKYCDTQGGIGNLLKNEQLRQHTENSTNTTAWHWVGFLSKYRWFTAEILYSFIFHIQSESPLIELLNLTKVVYELKPYRKQSQQMLMLSPFPLHLSSHTS